MANGLNAYLPVDDEELNPAAPTLMDYMAVDEMGNARVAPQATAESGALAKMYDELSRKAVSDEQAGISQLSKYLDDYQAQPQETDFRALAAWADTLRPGTKIADVAAAMAPNREARTQKFLELQDKLQQRKGGLAQRQLSGLTAQLNRQAQSDMLKQRQLAADQQFQQRQDLAKQKAEFEKARSAEYERHNKVMEDIAARRIEADMARLAGTQGRADKRQEAGLAEKREKKVEDHLIKFEQKAIDAVPLVENLEAIEDIIGGKLEQFDPKTGTINGKKVDLPGKSIPGVGRVFMPGSVGESLQAAFSNIFNTTLKERSGAAVTDQELVRMKSEFAQGKFNTEEKMLEALQRYKNILRKRMRQHEAAFSPEVRERFKKQGGMLADDFFPEPGAGKPPPGATRKEWEGKTYELQGDTWVEVEPGAQ
jgi:hypothetical protein